MNTNYLGKHRSVLAVILLGWVTFGIYPLYWMYQVTKELSAYTGSYMLSPGRSVFFTIITFGLYSFLWWYKMNILLMDAQYEMGYSIVHDNKFLLILLALFGLQWVDRAILQTELNELWQKNIVAEKQASTFEDSDDEWTDF